MRGPSVEIVKIKSGIFHTLTLSLTSSLSLSSHHPSRRNACREGRHWLRERVAAAVRPTSGRPLVETLNWTTLQIATVANFLFVPI